jgi:uncharacterized protein (TIGR02284 family)
MTREEMIDSLNSLIQLDIDAVSAYEQAIKNIDDPIIRDRITEFKEHHGGHTRDLFSLVQKMGGTPPDLSPDFKGFLIQGFTAIRSATGTEGALRAMELNEKLTNRNYSEAVGWDWTPEAKILVEKNFSDEKIHLEYIQSNLRSISLKR